MYALFKLHGWKPSEYYNMGYGEMRIAAAFIRREAEDMSKS